MEPINEGDDECAVLVMVVSLLQWGAQIEQKRTKRMKKMKAYLNVLRIE